jgi:tetratricopeptide (TPR) repeat protein
MPHLARRLLGALLLPCAMAVVPAAHAQVMKLSPEAVKAVNAGNFAPCVEEMTKALAAPANGALREAALAERARCWFLGINSLAERTAFLTRKYQTAKGAEDFARKQLADELQAALADANAAIAINPANATALNIRGLVHDRRDENAEAIADFARASNADILFFKAGLNSARTKRKMGDLEGALADLDGVAKFNPQVADIYLIRAEIHAAQKKPDLSVADLSRILVLEPTNTQLLLRRAEYQLMRPDYAAAAADLQRAIAIDPKLIDYAGKQGDLMMAQDKPAGAVAFYNILIAAKPGSAALVKRAEAQMAAGATDAALTDLDKAIVLDPNSAAPQVSRVAILTAQGKGAQASAELDALITRWPFEPAVKELAVRTPELGARLEQLQLSKYRSLYAEALAKMRDLGKQHVALIAVYGVRNQYTPLWQELEDGDRFIKLDTEAKYAANDVMQAASGALDILKKDPEKNTAEIATFQQGATEALGDYRAYESNIAKVSQELARVRKAQALERNAN